MERKIETTIQVRSASSDLSKPQTKKSVFLVASCIHSSEQSPREGDIQRANESFNQQCRIPKQNLYVPP